MMFLAVPGGWTVEAFGPLFPAAKTIVSSWFPTVPESASRTAVSCAWQSVVYVVPDVCPHELLEMRAPPFQAFAMRVDVGWLKTPTSLLLKTFELPTLTQGAMPSPYW